MTDTSLTNPPINANHNSLANPLGNSLPNPMAHNSSQHGFSFFTNYAHVLLLIAQASDVRMRELAADIGITERAIQRIIEELVTAGYLSVKKEGRRNRYDVRVELPLKRLPVAHRTVGDLVRFANEHPQNQFGGHSSANPTQTTETLSPS